MAPAATDRRIDIPVVDEFFAELPLSGAGWGFPVQVGDLVEWPKVILRSAMAFETPAHALGFGVIDDFHVVHLTVTGDATDSPVHMHGMVEVDVIRCLVDSDPGNRISRFPGFADGGKLRTEGLDLGVTVHAGLGSGNVGVGGFLDAGMTVATVHAQLVDMEGMIEGHRLRRLVTDPGIFGGKIVGHAGDHAGRHHRNTDQYLDRKPVGPSWKNIGHEVRGMGKSVGIRGLG